VQPWRAAKFVRAAGDRRVVGRGHLAESVRAALVREKAEQDRLVQTADWREGIRATAERRAPVYQGR